MLIAELSDVKSGVSSLDSFWCELLTCLGLGLVVRCFVCALAPAVSPQSVGSGQLSSTLVPLSCARLADCESSGGLQSKKLRF